MRLVGLVLLVLAAVVAGYWHFSRRHPPAEPPDIQVQGIDPRVAAAIESARDTVRRRPRSGGAWGHLGMVLHAHEYYAEAIACYRTAEQLDPAQFRWPYFQANLLEASDREAAAEAYRRALAIQPGIAQLRVRFGELLMDLGRRDEAQEQLTAALELSPGDSQTFFRLAQLAVQRGDYAAARQWAEQSAASPPARREVHELLAQVYHRLGESKKLEETRARLRAGRFEEGYWRDPFFEELKRLRQDSMWLAFEANQKITAGQVPEGLAIFETLLADRPGDAAVREQLAQAYLRLNDLESAGRVLDEGLRLASDSFALHRLRGSVHLLKSQWEPAVAEFCESLALKPDDPAAHQDLGFCLTRLRLSDAAIAEFREAVRYRPEMVEARLQLAGLLLNRGDREEAQRELQTVLDLAPQEPTATALLKLASGQGSDKQ